MNVGGGNGGIVWVDLMSLTRVLICEVVKQKKKKLFTNHYRHKREQKNLRVVESGAFIHFSLRKDLRTKRLLAFMKLLSRTRLREYTRTVKTPVPKTGQGGLLAT